MQELIYDSKTPLTFGKHIGKSIGEIRNIEPSYFVHLWKISNEGKNMFDANLAKYISENIEALRMEMVKAKQQKFYERK